MPTMRPAALAAALLILAGTATSAATVESVLAAEIALLADRAGS